MMRRENGIALVIVLWVVMLLSVMAASFAYNMSTETRLASHGLDRARGRALAEAAVSFVAYRLFFRPEPAHPWPVDGSPVNWRFGTGKVQIKVRDASGLIDLNQAQPELLKRLLMTAGGLNDDQAQTMLERIEDYRDPDDVRRPNGAERQDYLQAGYSYGPKNGPFESVSELQQVLGMTPELYGRIADALTVMSHQSGVNPALASAKVLRAIPGLDPQTVQDYLQQRAARQQQNLPPPPLPGAGSYVSTTGGLAFYVSVRAQPANATAPTYVTAVIGGRQRAQEAYHIAYWQEGRPAQTSGAASTP